MNRRLAPYDALLVCSFGGPNSSEDVVPFLRNVVRGKGVPDERLEEVGEHYYAVGAKSPINEQNIALRQALADELARRGLDLPVIWGNRNWHPYTVDALRDAHAFGARRLLVILTSAYASYSSTRQYREHLAASLADLGPARTASPIRPRGARAGDDEVGPSYLARRSRRGLPCRACPGGCVSKFPIGRDAPVPRARQRSPTNQPRASLSFQPPPAMKRSPRWEGPATR